MDTSKGETPDPVDGETPETDTAPAEQGETPAPDISGLKSALAKERQARERAERDRKALRDQIGQLVSPEKFETVEAQVTTLTQERDAAAARALRLEVALDKGLPAALARRLLGDTREEIESDADELLSTMGGRPATPDAKAGTGNGQPAKADLNTLLRMAAGKG